MKRKVIEANLAYRVNQSYTKDEILQRYFNEIYYGNLAYEVEAATEDVFRQASPAIVAFRGSTDRPASRRRPTSYDPLAHPQDAKARQIEVLQLMVKHGYLTADQATAAAAEPLKFHAKPISIQAPHFVMYVRSILEQTYWAR